MENEIRRAAHKRTLSELVALIEEKRAELKALEREAHELVHSGRLEAIAKARNIMRAYELSIDEIIAR